MIKPKKRGKNLSGVRSRLFSVTIASAFVFAIAGILINHFFTSSLYMAIAKNNLSEAADEIASYDLWNTSFYNEIAELESVNNLYVEIYLLPETTIYATRANDYLYDADYSPVSNVKDKTLRTIAEPEINEDGSYFDTKQEINGTARYLVYNNPIVNEYFALRIYVSYDQIILNATHTTNFINILFAVIFVMITSFLILYENLFTKPLITINEVTKKLASLDFSVTCPKSTIAEINELGLNINHLSSALDMSLTDLKERNRQLLDDIENEQQLEKARKEFISNASHELKTPISIIQGYAEGLKIGIANGENADIYCDIIIEESQKMNNLVIKLLEISQYESGIYKLNKERFNINYAVESLVKPRIKLLKEDGITLCININPDYIGYGDIARLDTIMNNYVSNAVSHCSGKKLIIVGCQPHEDKYRVSVYNTGENIADDDIDKIWNSFYRADKAHSRAAGRFGLGLSFVKSIQDLHKNAYGVINRDDGVEFWFDINKAKGKFEDND